LILSLVLFMIDLLGDEVEAFPRFASGSNNMRR
jgi:hypothetical protein